MACVNWSGAQLEGFVVNGLDKQPLKTIANTIADLGFNCVRLVNSLDVIYKNPVSEIWNSMIMKFMGLSHFLSKGD